jgi:hypothetical protein
VRGKKEGKKEKWCFEIDRERIVDRLEVLPLILFGGV